MKFYKFLCHFVKLNSRKTALDEPLYKLSAGRSMVEMLGVLAIIGVLSVGAISGYSTAMNKYKLNKQAEQMNTVISAVARYHKDLRINDGSTSSTSIIPILKKLNEIPQDMYIANNDTQIEDVFKNHYEIYHHYTGYVGIAVKLDSTGDSTQCQNLYMITKAFHADIHSIFLNYSEGGQQLPASSQKGDKYCTSEEDCLRNLTIAKANELCSIFNENTTWWRLYIIWR